MFRWINEIRAKRYEEKRRKEQEWRVQITNNYWLCHPTRYRPLDKWEKWGEMQSMVLSHIIHRIKTPSIFWRFHTFLPEVYKDIINLCEYETIQEDKKKGHVFVLRNCWNQNVWKQILSSLGLVTKARCIFILDYNPVDWLNTVNDLFKITQKIETGHSTLEFESELSSCRCLCYSNDEDLIIAKVDIKEEDILSILQDVAREFSLNLVIQNTPIY